MKKFLFLLTALSFLSFASCNKSDGPDKPAADFGNLFDCTYSMTADGCCVLNGLQPASAEAVNAKVTGYGWKVVGIYEVLDNGKLSRTNYRQTVLGGGYVDYWFSSGSRIVSFSHGDATGKTYHATTWSYDAARGFIMHGKASQDTPSRYMQVLRFSRTEEIYHQMFTLQQLGFRSDGQGNLKPIFCMVAYLRMTDKELANTKKEYNYDANIDSPGDVPNDCKFRVSARYANPDDFDENTTGAVIAAFTKVEFSLTDHLGTALLPNPALEYFDSIVWRSNSLDLPDKYVIHCHGQSQAQTTLKWTTYFFDKTPDLTTVFEGYKNGRVVYEYTMRHDIYTDKFLCYDWDKVSNKPRQFTASCVLDGGRSFTVYEPTAYNGDISKPYAELRYNSEAKGKGNDIAIMLKEAQVLADLMTNHYGTGAEVGKLAEQYRAMFKALPEKADIKHYWQTANTHIALVCNHNATKADDNYYYVHAEPIQK